MNVSKYVAPLALVVALGATAISGLGFNAANADNSAVLETKLQTAQADLREANRTVADLTAQVQEQDQDISRLVKQDRQDRNLRECTIELGKMMVNGMEVSYGWATPDQQLSSPCSDWLWQGESLEGDAH